MVTREEIAQTREEIRERDRELAGIETQLSQSAGQPIPQRRFGGSVTRAQQEQVVETRGEARQGLKQIRDERSRLQNIDRKLEEQSTIIADFEKAKKVLEGDAPVFALDNKRQREFFQELQLGRKEGLRAVEREFNKEGLRPIFDAEGRVIRVVVEGEQEQVIPVEDLATKAQEDELLLERLERAGIIEVTRQTTEQEVKGQEKVVGTVTAVPQPEGILETEIKKISDRQALLNTIRIREGGLTAQQRGELFTGAVIRSGLESAVAIKTLPTTIKAITTDPKGALANIKANLKIEQAKLKSGEVATFIRQQPEVTTGKLTALAIETVILSTIATKTLRFLKKPIKVVAPPPKTTIKSVDIIQRVTSSKVKAQFVIVAKTAPQIAIVQTRLDVVLSGIGRGFTIKKAPKLIPARGRVVKVRRGFQTTTVSQQFFIKKGRTVGTVATITARQRGKIVLRGLRGGILQERLKVVPVRGIERQAVKKLRLEGGLTTPIDIQKGLALGIDVKKATRAGKITDLTDKTKLTQTDLTAITKKIQGFKTSDTEIDIFRTETILKTINVKKLTTRKFRRPDEKLQQISGLTLFIEKAPKVPSAVGKSIKVKSVSGVASIKAPLISKIATPRPVATGKILTQAQKGVTLSSGKVTGAGLTTATKGIERGQQKLKPRAFPVVTRGITTTKTTTKVSVKPISRTAPKTTTRLVPKAVSKTIPKLGAKLAPRLISKQATKLVTKTTTRVTSGTRGVGRGFAPVTPLPRAIIPAIPLRDRKKLSQSAPKVEGFRTFVIKGGKKVFIKGIRPRQKALKVGAETTLGTLRATFGIEPTGKTIRQSDVEFTIPRDIFRESKIRKGKRIATPNIFIQKAPKRLTTGRERRAIQTARIKGVKI